MISKKMMPNFYMFGCEVFCENGAFKVAPFEADQVDPTGAGDCFLGGFAAGIVRGLAVPDAALLGPTLETVWKGRERASRITEMKEAAPPRVSATVSPSRWRTS